MDPFSKTVAVYGSSAISQNGAAAQNAERLGRLLAEAKMKICNGGYMGAMEACSRGAREAGGQVVGVICAAFSKRRPNPHLTEIIDTRDLPERITTLMRLADAYIVLDGNIGTMAELFLAWNVAATGWDKPVLVVGDSMKKAVFELQAHTEISEKQLAMLTFVDDVDRAVDCLKSYFNSKQG
ncbi:MAG: LOG family protein [Candidatus Omnitrophica bacterium]|nr:LOG family protein [Candidatus Omnitrophota bacterium]